MTFTVYMEAQTYDFTDPLLICGPQSSRQGGSGLAYGTSKIKSAPAAANRISMSAEKWTRTEIQIPQ